MRIVTILSLVIAAGCGAATTATSGDGGTNPQGCPATSPPNDSACSLVAGTECNYGCGEGGPSRATCTGSKWSVAYLEIACAPDAGGDASPPPADAPFACGSETCGVTQYCLRPCCGGALPPCEPMPDSGTCPPGTHTEQCQPFGGGSFGKNCRPDPCTPPPPKCVDDPKSQGCGVLSPGSRDVVCLCG